MSLEQRDKKPQKSCWAVALVGFVVLSGVKMFTPDEPRSRPLLGNREETVAGIRTSDPQGFRFAVLGDPESNASIFEGLLKRAAARGAAFAVLTGDLVQRDHADDWAFTLHELREAAATGMPIFAAPGNHDIANNSGRFEEAFDNRFFSFVYQSCLFILLDNSRAQIDPDQWGWLQTTLERHRPQVKHIFLFMHYPPLQSVHPKLHGFSGMERLRELARQYRVDYVFGGHYHDFYRTEQDGVVYLVTGGGGGRLKKLTGLPKSFHVIEVSVQGPRVTDEIVSVEDRDVGEDVEWFWQVKLPRWLRHIVVWIGYLSPNE